MGGARLGRRNEGLTIGVSVRPEKAGRKDRTGRTMAKKTGLVISVVE